MKRLGWEEDYIHDIMKLPADERPDLTVTLLEDPGNLKVPIWKVLEDETIKIIQSGDRDLNQEVRQLFSECRNLDGTININKLSNVFREYEKVNLDEMDSLPGNYRQFRRLLESKFGNNKLFSTRGFTITPDGNYGLREWVMSNPDVGFNLEKMSDAGFNLNKIVLPWE